VAEGLPTNAAEDAELEAALALSLAPHVLGAVGASAAGTPAESDDVDGGYNYAWPVVATEVVDGVVTVTATEVVDADEGGGGGSGGGSSNSGGGHAPGREREELARLLDAMFGSLAEAQRAEEADDPAQAGAHFGAAVALAARAGPLQARLDPRAGVLLNAKKAEFSARWAALLAEAERREEAREAQRGASLAAAAGKAAGEHEGAARQALGEALSLDEHSRPEDALPLYLQAADQYLKALALLPRAAAASASGRGGGGGGGGSGGERQAELRSQALSIMDRIEAIKKQASATVATVPPLEAAEAPAAAPSGGAWGSAATTPAHRAPPPAAAVGAAAAAGGGGAWGAGEIDVLRRSSRIHGRLFLPWTADDARQERFSYSAPWEDPEVKRVVR